MCVLSNKCCDVIAVFKLGSNNAHNLTLLSVLSINILVIMSLCVDPNVNWSYKKIGAFSVDEYFDPSIWLSRVHLVLRPCVIFVVHFLCFAVAPLNCYFWKINCVLMHSLMFVIINW